jgi:uncharacterized membrane protein YcfT
MEQWAAFAQPFRMPDFFFISGLLLSRVIDRPWRTYAEKKVVHYLYFFLLWSLIYFAARLAIGHMDLSAAGLGREFLKVMFHGPFAMLWFIQMLSFYFVITKVLQRVPWHVMLPLAVLWYLATVETPWMQVNRAGERFVFFYAGYVFSAHAFNFARWAARQRAQALAGLLAWAFLNGALVFSGATVYQAVLLPLGFLGAFAVIALAALLQSLHWADWLRHCGKHSLPIYLSFYIPMSLLANLYLAATSRLGLQMAPATLAVLLCVASIAIALGACRLLRHTPLAFLYERPEWARLSQPSGKRGHGEPAEPVVAVATSGVANLVTVQLQSLSPMPVPVQGHGGHPITPPPASGPGQPPGP